MLDKLNSIGKLCLLSKSHCWPVQWKRLNNFTADRARYTDEVCTFRGWRKFLPWCSCLSMMHGYSLAFIGRMRIEIGRNLLFTNNSPQLFYTEIVDEKANRGEGHFLLHLEWSHSHHFSGPYIKWYTNNSIFNWM